MWWSRRIPGANCYAKPVLLDFVACRGKDIHELRQEGPAKLFCRAEPMPGLAAADAYTGAEN